MMVERWSHCLSTIVIGPGSIVTAFEVSRSMGDCMSPAQNSGKFVAQVALRRELVKMKIQL